MGQYFISCRNCHHPVSNYMLNESSIRGVMRIKNINDTSSTPVFGNECLTKPYECEKICEVLTEPQEIDFHLTSALDIKEDSS